MKNWCIKGTIELSLAGYQPNEFLYQIFCFIFISRTDVSVLSFEVISMGFGRKWSQSLKNSSSMKLNAVLLLSA